MENYNYDKVNSIVSEIENKYNEEFAEKQRVFEANKDAMSKSLDMFYSLVSKLNNFASINKFQITHISTSRQGNLQNWDVFESLEVKIHLEPTSRFSFIEYKNKSEASLKAMVAAKSTPICNKFLKIVGLECCVDRYSLMEGGNNTIVLIFNIKP